MPYIYNKISFEDFESLLLRLFYNNISVTTIEGLVPFDKKYKTVYAAYILMQVEISKRKKNEGY